VSGDLGGRVAIVTGAGSGIGRAAALQFAALGARVVAADVDRAGAEETVEQARSAGGEVIAVPTDVADEASVTAMVAAAVDAYGGVDVAFNNAGISPPPKAFTDHTLDDWNRVIAVNLTGVFLCLQAELRQMVAQGRGGAIVNTSSGAGHVPAPGQPQYTAAKHGVLGLTKQAAQEYARAGIRVNAILPGNTDTTMMRAYLSSQPELRVKMERMMPFGRLATADEVAAAAVWLCSDAASYVSGVGLPVDGALTLR
jgi:NAD(P)-dependent dehydrogenase (short-subunit alcohol dehydrogenase family)